MARINKYKYDENITRGDKVIGSDSVTNKTRNYAVGDLTAFLGKQDEILGNKFSYRYRQSKQYASLFRGEFSLLNNNTTYSSFEDVTNIYINRYNESNNDVLPYFSQILGKNGVLVVHAVSDTTLFGVYRVLEINNFSGDVIELVVELVAFNGEITDLDYITISSTFAIGDKDYTHNQINASSEWVITHGLNKLPSVTIVDSGNNVVVGDITYNSKEQITINFNAALSGKAYLN